MHVGPFNAVANSGHIVVGVKLDNLSVHAFI
jgi:hypothetical protein